MEESIVDVKATFVANDQAAKIAEPSKSSFDFPSVTVAAQLAPILGRRFAPSATMRGNQLDSTLAQLFPQRVAVVGAVGDQSLWAFFRTTSSKSWNRDLGQSFFNQGYFPRRGSIQVVSQRNTLAVDHHHPLRAFAPLGFADAIAPFFAGAKLPSIKLSLQSNCWRWSSSDKNCRQILSQTPSFSQRCNRRQQVLELGYSLGKSRHRAPVLRIQRIPSSTRRLSAHGRPPLFSCGNSGSILFHCPSDKNASGILSFSHNHPSRTSTKCCN